MFLSDPHPQAMPVKVAVVGGNVWGKSMFTLAVRLGVHRGTTVGDLPHIYREVRTYHSNFASWLWIDTSLVLCQLRGARK